MRKPRQSLKQTLKGWDSSLTVKQLAKKLGITEAYVRVIACNIGQRYTSCYAHVREDRLLRWDSDKTLPENARLLGISYSAVAQFKYSHNLVCRRAGNSGAHFKGVVLDFYRIRQAGKRGFEITLPAVLMRKLGWGVGDLIIQKISEDKLILNVGSVKRII